MLRQTEWPLGWGAHSPTSGRVPSLLQEADPDYPRLQGPALGGNLTTASPLEMREPRRGV